MGRTYWESSRFAVPRPVTNVHIKWLGPGQGAHDEKLISLPRQDYFQLSERGRATHDETLANLPRRDQLPMWILRRRGGDWAHMMNI